MRLLGDAWDEVTGSTIANCWKHTQICPPDGDEWEDIFVDSDAPDSGDESDEDGYNDVVMQPVTTTVVDTQKVSTLRAAWDVVLEFARVVPMTLPEAMKRLEAILGEDYVPSEWSPALDAVMDAEENIVAAEEAVRALMPDFSKVSQSSLRTDATGAPLPSPIASDRWLKEAENAFSDVLLRLRKERCIRGDEASLDDLLNPLIEQEDLDSEFLRFADGDVGVDQILDYIRKQDEDSDDDEEAPEPEFNFSKKDAMAAVDLIQKIVRHRPDLEVALPLGGYLHKFRVAMGQEVEDAKVQTNITSFFK
jgi:hypothetical protein